MTDVEYNEAMENPYMEYGKPTSALQLFWDFCEWCEKNGINSKQFYDEEFTKK